MSRFSLLSLIVLFVPLFPLPLAAQPEPAQPEPLLQVEGVLEESDPTLSDDNTRYDEYRFEGKAGQTITIVLESVEFDAYLRLKNQSGQMIEKNDDYADGNKNSAITITLPESGTYTLVANAYEAGSRGRYRLTVLAGSEPVFWAAAEQIRLLEQILAEHRAKNDRENEAATLYRIAEVYDNQKQYEQALVIYQHALALGQALNEGNFQADVLTQIGVIHLNQEAYAEALENYQQALKLYQADRSRLEEGETLNRIGVLYFRQKDYPAALDYYQQALTIHREVKNAAGELQTLNNIAGVYSKQEKYSEATEYYQQILAIYRAKEDRYNEAETLYKLGETHYSLEQYSQALEFYQQALTIYREQKKDADIAWALLKIGKTYDEQENYSQALETAQQALQQFRSISNQLGEARSLDTIGYIYIHQEKFAEAQGIFQQEIIVARQIPDQRTELIAMSGVANTLSTQARLLLFAGAYTEAIPVYEQARPQWEKVREFAKAIEDSDFEQSAIEQIVITYEQTASAFSYQQQYAESIIAQRKALDSLEIYRDRLPEEKFLEERGSILGQLGITYSDNSQYAESIAAHRESAQISAQLGDFAEQAQQLFLVAGSSNRLNQYRQALEASQEALGILEAKLPQEQELKMYVLSIIGKSYSDLGQYTSALEYYRQAQVIARDLGEVLSENIMTNNIGNIYHAKGQYLQALDSYRQAQETNQSAIQRLQAEGISATEELCGETTAGLGTLGQQRCLDRFQSFASTILTNLGVVYGDLGRYAEALNAQEQALVYSRNKDNRYEESTILGNIGVIRLSMGDYSKAIEVFQQSLSIAEDINNRSGQATACVNLGLVYANQGKYPQALEFYQQALTLAREIDAPSTEATVLGNIGAVYQSQGNLAEALAQYQASMAIRQKLGESLITNLNNIGSAYGDQGRYVEALEKFQQGLEIAKTTGDQSSEAITLSNIAFMYAEQSDYAKALQFQQQSSTLKQQLGSNSAQLSSLLGLGSLYQLIGQYEQARTAVQQALSLSRKMADKPSEAAALNSLAIIYQAQAQFDQALNYFQQAMQSAQEMGDIVGDGRTQRRIALIYQQQGKSNEAVVLLGQALKTFRTVGVRPDQGKTLNSLGLAYASQGKTAEAIDALQQAIVIHREIGDRASEAEALANLGKVFAQQNQPEVAIAFYKQSVNLTEQIRQGLRTLSRDQQESYTSTITDRYRALADLLISQKLLLEAEQVIELLKTQEIYEYTRGTVSKTGQIGFTPAEQAVLTHHDSLIAFAKIFADCNAKATCSDTIRGQKGQLNQDWSRVVTALEAETAGRDRRADDRGALALNNLPSIGRQIVEAQPNTVMIYPIVQNQRLSILWVAPGGLFNAIQVEVDEREIALAVSQFRALMRTCEVSGCTHEADIQAIQAVSQQLHRWLIPPQLKAELEKNQIKNLVFSLDRFLRYVPMSALYDGQHYLIEDYAISTVTAAGTQNRNNPLPAANQISVLGLGLSESVPADPSKGISYPFGQLDQVPNELAAIVQPSAQASNTRGIPGVFKGSVLLNPDFNRAALRTATQYQILHIATHGSFDPVSAFNAFLVLGTKEALTIQQIQDDYGNDIFGKLSLVVLSACETALGEAEQHREGIIPSGKEIPSIAQTFIESGADTIVASLWQVNDPATAALMHQFYGNLAANTPDQPVTIAQALQTAQLSLLNSKAAAGTLANRSDLIPGGVAVIPNPDRPAAITRYAHPYYWSAFTIIGDGL